MVSTWRELETHWMWTASHLSQGPVQLTSPVQAASKWPVDRDIDTHTEIHIPRTKLILKPITTESFWLLKNIEYAPQGDHCVH